MNDRLTLKEIVKNNVCNLTIPGGCVTINCRNHSNLVSFVEASLDPVQMNQLIQERKHIGLNDPALEDNLRAGRYQPVLQALWSERDRDRRLAFLDSKKQELHPVLMFEEAIARFGASPTNETVHSVAIPLIDAAAFRVNQDAQCASDCSVKYGDAAARMHLAYGRRLTNRVQALMHRPLHEIAREHQQELKTSTTAKVLDVARQSLSTELPSPDWVGFHGMELFISGKPDMYPADQYAERRHAYARTEIVKLNHSAQ